MKYLILFVLFLFPSSIFAQENLVRDAPNGTENFNIEGLRKQELNYDKFQFQKEQKQINSIKLDIPSGLTENKKNEVKDLWRQIKEICPDCSTGGTIGGGVVVGGNPPGGQPLFPISSPDTVTIPKARYDYLVEKAAACSN